jgi:hypothetical protein
VLLELEYRRKCDKCAARKPSKQKNRAPLGQYLAGDPMERVAVDILGPLPVTERGNRYILVLTDCFTKWTEVYGKCLKTTCWCVLGTISCK